MKSLLYFLLILILLVAGVAGGGYAWLRHYAETPAPMAQEVSVLIPPGSGGEKIAILLAEAGAITHPDAFRLLSIMEGKHQRFQAGEYLFTVGITPLGVMEKLASGDIVHHLVTIPEGKTSAEIFRILAADKILTGEVKVLPAEGSLLPETYDFLRGTTRTELLARMAKAQKQVLDNLWPQRQSGLPFATPLEAITLASIVEKETGIPAERSRIAGVYVNRLKIGMPLQADPTVAYGRYGGQYADKPLTLTDLKTDSPYNTYMHTGLPPGPICHPGKAAIEAVLNPMQTKELYFVATGDGGHRFAETNDQHSVNVREYRKWRAAEQAKPH